ncbi:MAG: hypothetical protein J1F35_00360 [Erysipelotrichales bacterium]|nr:hypothetical protein [Erysipelotrichales bacterium]
MEKLFNKKIYVLIRLLAIICVFLGGYILDRQYQSYMNMDFSVDRLLFIFMICIYLSFNIYFGIRKTNEFCFKKRYLIGLVLFIYIVSNGYHGSSIYVYNEVVEPSYSITSSKPFISQYRGIRSDEFLVDTPVLLNQALKKPNYSSINNSIMAQDKTVLMFPQLPTYNISVLSNPRLFGFFFLNIEQAFSFYWYLVFFAGFFGILELLLIVTKQKKLLSVAGAFLIIFSPGVQWWGAPGFLAYGSWVIVIFNQFFKEKKVSKRILLSILLGWVGSMYIMLLYPAWMLTYGYMYLGFVIYILYLNRKDLKPSNLLYLLPTIITMIIIILPAIIGSTTTIERMTQTLYPGARKSVGGQGWPNYFNYLIALFYNRHQIANASEYSQYISFFPIPLLIGIYQIIKNTRNKKQDVFLNCMVAIAILMGIWNFVKLPIFSRITLLYMSPPERSLMTVSVMCTIIAIYLMAHYENKKISDVKIGISFLISCIILLFAIRVINNYVPGYLTINLTTFIVLLYLALFMMLLLNYKKTNIMFCIVSVIISGYVLVTVNPVSKGLEIMFEKPIAKEIQQIVDEDEDAKWLVADASIYIQSYLLANGARVINSTNYYPNFELWEKFDPERLEDENYNRYAHIIVSTTEDDTYFELLSQDAMRINVSISDFCKFDAKYVVSERTLEDYNNSDIQFEKIYKEENLGIYQTSCVN